MKEVDISQTLKDAENALRDFIALTLNKSLGDNWIDLCGVQPNKIKQWKKTKTREEKKLSMSGVVEKRLLYYANFSDLEIILEHHWDKFSDTFGDWEKMKVWLDTLRDLRNPDAHRRELLPHQKYLAAGIAGEIRTRIVRSRNKKLDVDAYFPKIESVRDNYGNLYTPDDTGSVQPKLTLRIGDTLEFVITASDPRNEGLLYRIKINSRRFEWQQSNVISYKISESDVGRSFFVTLAVRSKNIDDYDLVFFTYSVLPDV